MHKTKRRSVLVVGLALPVLAVRWSAVAQTGGEGSPEQRLRDRGIVLPEAPVPVANYVPSIRTGNLVFVSGQGPRKPDGTLATGKVGKDVTSE